MAMDAGLRSELPLGGVIGVSGWVAFIEEYPEALTSAARAREYLVTHGLQDPMVPFEATAAQCKRLRELGLDLEFKPYDKEHTMLPDEVEDIRSWLAARLG
jgi:phospholipase/carboxylesterase